MQASACCPLRPKLLAKGNGNSMEDLPGGVTECGTCRVHDNWQDSEPSMSRPFVGHDSQTCQAGSGWSPSLSILAQKAAGQCIAGLLRGPELLVQAPTDSSSNVPLPTFNIHFWAGKTLGKSENNSKPALHPDAVKSTSQRRKQLIACEEHARLQQFDMMNGKDGCLLSRAVSHGI